MPGSKGLSPYELAHSLPSKNDLQDAISEYLNHITFSAVRQRCSGANCDAICSATRIPSIAAEVIPPAYPAPSPQG